MQLLIFSKSQYPGKLLASLLLDCALHLHKHLSPHDPYKHETSATHRARFIEDDGSSRDDGFSRGMMAILGVGCVYLGDLEAGVGHGVPHHGHDLGGELPLLLPGCIYTS